MQAATMARSPGEWEYHQLGKKNLAVAATLRRPPFPIYLRYLLAKFSQKEYLARPPRALYGPGL